MKPFKNQKLAFSILLLGVVSLTTNVLSAAEDSNNKDKTSKEPKITPVEAEWKNETKFPAIPSGKWTGSRLPDGQPNISGHWSNTIANQNNFTDPQGGIPNDPDQKKPLGPREKRAPSRVSEPADGQIPFQPWALEKVKEFQVGFHNPVYPGHVEPNARCAPGGIPKSLYWHGYEIAQYPGSVVFFFDNGTRIIHLNKKAHLDEKLKLWNGDSRGHWEGNTLVVDVANINGKSLFGRSGEFISENGHIVEKYIFNQDGSRYNYVAEFTDPTVYTKPFTVTIPARKWTEKDKAIGWHFDVIDAKHAGKERIVELFERTCVENNGGFGLGARK